MDTDPDRPGAELDLKLLEEDFGHRWEIYVLPVAGRDPAWLAYDRQRPMYPAVTADSAEELRDRLALLAGHPRPPAAT